MINLRTFNLEKINEYKHYSLIRDMDVDADVKKYISRNFSRWIKSQVSEKEDDIEANKSYVIVKDNKYIGFIGSMELSSTGVLEVWCAIDKEFRNKGYGDKLLGEITPYYIEKIDGLNDICLKINKYNFPSKKVALENGYTEYSVNDDVVEYRYFNKRSR